MRFGVFIGRPAWEVLGTWPHRPHRLLRRLCVWFCICPDESLLIHIIYTGGEGGTGKSCHYHCPLSGGPRQCQCRSCLTAPIAAASSERPAVHISPVVAPPPPSAAAASAPSGAARKWTTVQSGPVLEEWQLPDRYRRLPMEQQEMECINVGY